MKTKNTKTFHFDTGVKFDPSYPDIKGHKWVPAAGGGLVKVIPFDCDNVPDGATFMFACDYDDQTEALQSDVIVREIKNSALMSKYAYFRIVKNNN